MKGRVSIPHRIEKNRNIRNRIIEVVTVSIPHRIEKNPLGLGIGPHGIPGFHPS